MNADDFPTPDVDVESVDPETPKGCIDASEDVTLPDARMQSDYEGTIATNLGQTAVDDEGAFTLELGPNNCAASQESLAGN